MSEDYQDPLQEFIVAVVGPSEQLLNTIQFSDEPDQFKAAQQHQEITREIAELVNPQNNSEDLIEVNGYGTMSVADAYRTACALLARRDKAGARHFKRPLRAYIDRAVEAQIKKYKGRKRASSPATAAKAATDNSSGGKAWENLDADFDAAVANAVARRRR